MKTLRQLCAALVLTLVLALSAIADDGQMNTPGFTQPPPQSSTSTDGQMDTPGVTGSNSTTTACGEIECGVTEALLSLIGSALSLS
ncbi:MAG TPA: hypothetical protein VGB17_09470 [Pyrinomonadaceae bacterium]